MTWHSRSYIADKFANCKVLEQADFPGATLLPSITVFYDEYPYRIKMKGNRIAFDIKRMADLEWYIKTACMGHFRFQSTLKNFYLYLEFHSDLKMLHSSKHIEDTGIKELFETYTGPLSVSHRDAIIGADTKIEIRDKKYFGKYNRKLSFNSFSYSRGDRDTHAERIKEISQFLKDNLVEGEEYMWYKKYHSYSSNFLYVKDKVWEEIGGYFLLQFSDMVYQNVKVVPPSEVI